MRNAMVVLLLGSLTMVLRCGDDEGLDRLENGAQVASAPIHWAYVFPEGDSVLGGNVAGDSLTVDTDSLRWVYEYPAGGPSTLGIVIRAQDSVHVLDNVPDSLKDSVRLLDSVRVQLLLALGVEVYTDSLPDTVFLAPDSTGVVDDTVRIVSSGVSGVIVPPHSSWLLVRKGDQIVGSVELVNPW